MGNITAFLSRFWTQGKQFWTSLTMTKRIALIGVLGLVLFIVSAFAFFGRDGGYEYLFVNLSEEDTAAIMSHLRNSGFNDFSVDDKGIRVPVDQIVNLRVKLTQEGLPTHGIVGWEKFDEQDFTRTEFEQKIFKIRAIQGELSRTIMSVNGISHARVHLVTPAQSLFVEDTKETTAAVYIKTKRGVSLDNRQVKGIVHLVAKSVEDLKPENVTIIDDEGKMLTEIASKDPTVRQSQQMIELKKNFEKELATRIRAIVGRVVGPDRVEAQVDVEIDYTEEEQTISDIDPDKAVPISTNTTNMEMTGSGLNPTGIPGSKSNVPGEQEDIKQAGSSSSQKKGSENKNFEISKTLKHRKLPVGKILRVAAAVLIDGKQAYPLDGSVPEFEPRTPEELKKIEELVKTAIGYIDNRDQVTVHNMLFQLDFSQVQAIQEKKKENQDYIATLAVSAVVAMSLVFFFAFVVRPYFRWLSYDPERKKKEAIVEEFKPDLELGSIQNVQVKEDVPFDKLSPQEQVMYLAKHEPQRTTEAIRILLNPHGNG